MKTKESLVDNGVRVGLSPHPHPHPTIAGMSHLSEGQEVEVGKWGKWGKWGWVGKWEWGTGANPEKWGRVSPLSPPPRPTPVLAGHRKLAGQRLFTKLRDR
jgi:hypothetical protein